MPARVASHDQSPPPRPLPAWARPDGERPTAQNVWFFAGATLAHLDTIIRSDPPFAGVWRQRLALRAAASTLRMAGRSEGEDDLRDAWRLRREGDALGPAGGHLENWRGLFAPTRLSPEKLNLLALSFDIARAPVDEMLQLVEGADKEGDPVKAAAEVAVAIAKLYPPAEFMGLWLADTVLARRLRWPRPLPLIALHLQEQPLRRAVGAATSRPGDEGFTRLVALAYANAAATAIDLAGDLHRRTKKLMTEAPRLRAKGARQVVENLLAEDAFAPSARIGGMSDRAMRRIADRLVALDAVRELTKRSSFRLYGL